MNEDRLINMLMLRMEEYGMPSYSLKDTIPALDIIQIMKDSGYTSPGYAFPQYQLSIFLRKQPFLSHLQADLLAERICQEFVAKKDIE